MKDVVQKTGTTGYEMPPRDVGAFPTVPQDVLTSFEKIRESGKCDMFDARCIMDAAAGWGFTALAQFITDNPALWRAAIVRQYEMYDETLGNLFGKPGEEGKVLG